MVSGAGFLKFLQLGKGAKAGSAIMGAAKTSKVAAFIGELPIVRIAAGSAVGVAILDTWNSAVESVSDTLGVDSDTSSLLLGIAVVICVSMVLSAALSLKGSRRSR